MASKITCSATEAALSMEGAVLAKGPRIGESRLLSKLLLGLRT